MAEAASAEEDAWGNPAVEVVMAATAMAAEAKVAVEVWEAVVMVMAVVEWGQLAEEAAAWALRHS